MLDIPSYMLGKKSGAGAKYIVVDELPQTGEEGIIYLVPKTTSKTNNVYNEYMYIDSTWELIGDTQADLSNYVDMSTAQTISGKKTYTTLPESSVAPTSDNQLSNKKYVDDSVGGKQNTIDSTHKLDADLVDDTSSTHKFFTGSSTDLLHYKGHVVSENNLPSVGQPTGTTIEPLITMSDSVKTTLFELSQNATASYNETLKNYETYKNNYIALIFSRQAGVAYFSGIIFMTDYPEQIHISAPKYTGEAAPKIAINVKYDTNKPVYFYNYTGRFNYFTAYDHRMVHKYDSSTTEIEGTRLETSQGATQILEDTTFFMFNANVTDGVTDGSGSFTKPTNNINLKTNITSVKFGETLAYYTTISQEIASIKVNQSTTPYIYNHNMVLVNNNSWQMSETDTELNDTYTVGETYDIYRRNENVQWEIWSKQLDLTSIAGYDESTTQVLKNVNGTITWVDET